MVTTGTVPRGRRGRISPAPHFCFQTKREKFRSVDWAACHMKHSIGTGEIAGMKYREHGIRTSQTPVEPRS